MVRKTLLNTRYRQWNEVKTEWSEYSTLFFEWLGKPSFKILQFARKNWSRSTQWSKKSKRTWICQLKAIHSPPEPVLACVRWTHNRRRVFSGSVSNQSHTLSRMPIHALHVLWNPFSNSYFKKQSSIENYFVLRTVTAFQTISWKYTFFGCIMFFFYVWACS